MTILPSDMKTLPKTKRKPAPPSVKTRDYMTVCTVRRVGRLREPTSHCIPLDRHVVITGMKQGSEWIDCKQDKAWLAGFLTEGKEP